MLFQTLYIGTAVWIKWLEFTHFSKQLSAYILRFDLLQNYKRQPWVVTFWARLTCPRVSQKLNSWFVSGTLCSPIMKWREITKYWNERLQLVISICIWLHRVFNIALIVVFKTTSTVPYRKYTYYTQGFNLFDDMFFFSFKYAL